MPLYWFLLVITSIACDSFPGRDVPLQQSILASIGLLSGWALLTRLAARSATRQVLADEVAIGPASAALGHQMEVLRWMGLAMSMLALLGFGLAGLVDRIPWGGGSIALRAALLMLPGLAATLWSWWCELRFDVAAQPTHAPPRGPLHHLLEMFRLQGAWLVLPILALLVLIDLTEWVFDVDPARGALVSALVSVIALPLLLPMILSRIWSLRLIPDPAHRHWCQSLVAATGIRGLQLRQWDTGGSCCTALVAGFVPYFRRLLLSDALLWRLNREQTAMVMLHELAHLRRWHLPLRLLVLLPVWAAASLVSHSLGSLPGADLVGIAAGVIASLLALRLIAYRTELDADATACRMAIQLAGRVEDAPACYPSAARALAEALQIVTADSPSSRRATWLHPSIESRCAKLEQAAAAASAAAPGAAPSSTLGDAAAGPSLPQPVRLPPA